MTNKSPAPRDLGKIKEYVLALLAIAQHNWPFKLMALVLAMSMWAMLSTTDENLFRTKEMDATISITGTADAVKRKGFIVTSNLNDLPTIKLQADVPQNEYENAQASDYNVQINLNHIRSAGTVELDVVALNSKTYGNVRSVEPSTVQLEVEEYVTRYRIPVQVYTTGEAPEGFYVGKMIVDPTMVSVSGPRSQVAGIVRAEAVIDLSMLPAIEGTITNAIPFTLVDANGNAVESRLLEVTSESVLLDTVSVQQTLYPRKTLTLSDVGLVIGTPASGYEIKNVTISPSTIVAAGPKETLDMLEELYAEVEIDVTGMTESIKRSVRVRRPTELAYLSQETVTVAVEIGEAIKSRTFDHVPVLVTGIESGLRYMMSPTTASVTVVGPELWLNDLRASELTLTVDASGLAADSVAYALPVLCELDNPVEGCSVQKVSPAKIDVTLREK